MQFFRKKSSPRSFRMIHHPPEIFHSIYTRYNLFSSAYSPSVAENHGEKLYLLEVSNRGV